MIGKGNLISVKEVSEAEVRLFMQPRNCEFIAQLNQTLD